MAGRLHAAGTPKNAHEAEKFGADIIVATGFDEGGTLPGKVLGTFSMLRALRVMCR